MPEYRNQSGQTIDLGGQDVGDLTLRNCRDMTFTGGVFRGQALVLDSENVNFVRPHAIGDGSIDAFFFRRSKKVSLVGGVIVHPRCGVKFLDVVGGLLSATSVSAMSVDGCDINSSQDVEVSDCAFAGSLLLGDQHPDAVQIWTDKDGELSARIRILRNTAHGSIQGFSCFGKPRGAQDVLIQGNDLAISRPNAITLSNVKGGKVLDNTIRTLPAAAHTPRADGRALQAKVNVCAGTLVQGNSVAAFGGKKAQVGV
jgi:hypothetical protein